MVTYVQREYDAALVRVCAAVHAGLRPDLTPTMTEVLETVRETVAAKMGPNEFLRAATEWLESPEGFAAAVDYASAVLTGGVTSS